MAMSNIRDGGTIILGVEEEPNGRFDPVGMNASDIDSFNFDNMQDHVNRYAHPYAKFLVSRIPDIQPRFIVVQVEQFDEIPVICGRNYCVSTKYKMMEGEIYTRTRTKPQSAKVMNYLDLKEIIDLAIERGVKLFIERSSAAGLALGQPPRAWDEEQILHRRSTSSFKIIR
jgi:predicted HTH transcriptional regulator